ncbi:hypothetical protein PIB30_083473 [Stylosanthes scabra]|uniref:Uncharacterized protein n=1 Tax=Stylosanthes scabra TaxID=79078 RepID=A0ABU6YRT1_9FABA|nr:hypothetical protein [Stylosanthes scabra]
MSNFFISFGVSIVSVFPLAQPLVRVSVPSSAAAAERRSFVLNLPRNASVAVIPHSFYTRYQRRLGGRLIFVDRNGRTHHMTLHKGRFSGTIVAGIGELMRYYNLARGGTVMARYAGRNLFHIRVSGPDGVVVA